MISRIKIIGLTGGIATGKSTISKMLKKWRYPVICADQIAHDVVRPTKTAYKKIVRIFGKDILQKNCTLNRQKIAVIVFKNPKMLRKLEKAVHPEVQKEICRLIGFYEKQKKKIVILDVPLLFESGLNKICDHVLCVAAPEKQQIQRLNKYRKTPQKDAISRIRNQMPLKIKIKKSDFVIWNTGTRNELRKKVAGWLKTTLVSLSNNC